jgi:heavy metal sensor kinase
LALTPDGRVILHEDYHNHPESRRVVDYYVELLAPDGIVLYRNEPLGGRELGGAPLPGEGVGGYSPRWTKLSDGTRIVLVSRQHSVNGKPILIRLAQSAEPAWRDLQFFAVGAEVMFGIVIAASAFAAGRMSRRILSPVKNIAARAEEITSQRLHQRIPLRGTGDEIDQLAEAFNRTLTRLDDSFRQLKQFTADASHELRTPLAAIRAIGEAGLERGGTSKEYHELVGSMLEEVGRLTHLVNDLLMISRGDAGSIQFDRSKVGVLDLVRNTVAILEPLALEEEQRLEVGGDDDAMVYGDPVFLRQALINLIHNAIKYSPKKSTTEISVKRGADNSVTVLIRDSGRGIAAEHLPHIFDRFYRADSGRSRDAGGFGLGLAISQWAVQAHKGTIAVSSIPGNGSTFAITLPAADTTDARSV